MQQILDKINSHNYLNNYDITRFIHNYSNREIKVKILNLESDAMYNELNNNIIINNHFKSKILNFLLTYSHKKVKFESSNNNSNFLVDLYNLYSLTILFHELHHAKQIKMINNFLTPKTKLIKENWKFGYMKPKLYEKYHDLYYHEYDAVISSFINTLNVISKCKNLNDNSIMEYNKIMTTIIYHSYGNSYRSDKCSIYNNFSSPILYSKFLSNGLQNEIEKKALSNCIKKIIIESSTEYSKLLNGCELSYETLLLLYNTSMGFSDTLNILNDVKEIDENVKKYKLTR